MKTMGTLTRLDDLIASYSSKGPTAIDHVVKPDIVAPGNRITAAAVPAAWLYRNAPDNGKVLRAEYEQTNSKEFSNDYFRLSGTSMSAALVSGAAALLLQKD